MKVGLSRIQFASTSIYHFLFVPITIGLAFLVAILHTAWYRSGNPEQRRLARFFGTSERFWINLQARYDLEVEKDRLGDALEGIHPLSAAS